MPSPGQVGSENFFFTFSKFPPFFQEEQETVRVVALDRSFHIDCYRCVDCNLLLSSEEQGRG